MSTISMNVVINRSDKARRVALLTTRASWIANNMTFHSGTLARQAVKLFTVTKLIIVKPERPMRADITVGGITISNIIVDGIFVFTHPCSFTLRNSEPEDSPDSELPFLVYYQ